MTKKIRIGTRGSKLALAQAELMRDTLLRVHPALEVEFVTIVTSGDRKQGTPLAESGDKKDWVLEIELAVLRGEIDLAAHSSKDVPVGIEPGTVLFPAGGRGNPRDAFVSREGLKKGVVSPFLSVRAGARVGTASLRRRAQLLRLRPDLEVVAVRGNVPTRIEKLRSSADLDGIVLACAGLDRLGLDALVREEFSIRDVVPAVGQGMLLAQYKEDREDIRGLLERTAVEEDVAAWRAERAVIEVLEADCRSAVGVYAYVEGNSVTVIARVLSHDGSIWIEDRAKGDAGVAGQLGQELGERLVNKGALEILRPNS